VFGTMLVIEDDRDLANLLAMHMRDLGFAVEMVHDGRLGLERALRGDLQFIILDIQLPGLLGFDVFQRLRREGVRTPILMLTSRTDEVDRVVGLETGADDYLTKPFSVRELQARVRAILRRTELAAHAQGEPAHTPEERPIVAGDLVIDPVRASASLAGVAVTLTAREFQLLLHFGRNPGRVYTREQLLEQVWGYGFDGYEHTVNTTINRLRGKIETDPAAPRYILTVRGLGYRFAETHELREP
jgi:DNA-binding response OmpR family regulator